MYNSSILLPYNVVFGLSLCRGVLSLGVQSLQIESLGLRSLRSVTGGLVLFHNNSRLCYISSLPWSPMLHPTQAPNLITSGNQDPQTCGKRPLYLNLFGW